MESLLPKKDLKGNEYGVLKVIKYLRTNASNQDIWLCRCSCGKKIKARGDFLELGYLNCCESLDNNCKPSFAKKLNSYSRGGSVKAENIEKEFQYLSFILKKFKYDYHKIVHDDGDYQRFISSKYWKIFSLYRRNQEGKCQICGSSESLCVHHPSYDLKGFEYKPSNIKKLKVVCNDCHIKLHKEIELNKQKEFEKKYKKQKQLRQKRLNINFKNKATQRAYLKLAFDTQSIFNCFLKRNSKEEFKKYIFQIKDTKLQSLNKEEFNSIDYTNLRRAFTLIQLSDLIIEFPIFNHTYYLEKLAHSSEENIDSDNTSLSDNKENIISEENIDSDNTSLSDNKENITSNRKLFLILAVFILTVVLIVTFLLIFITLDTGISQHINIFLM